jgi:anti-anti-sigma regulatory factor
MAMMNSQDRIVSWLRQWVTPQAEDRETAFFERAVYVVVGPTILVVMFLVVAGIVRGGAGLSGMPGWLLLLAGLVSIYVISRQGKARLGLVLLVGLDLCAVAYLMLSQGYQGAGALFLPLAVAMAGLFFGMRAGFMVAMASAVLHALVVLAQEGGWFVPAAMSSPWESVFSFVLVVCLLAGSVANFNRAYRAQREQTRVLTRQTESLRHAGEDKDRLLNDLETRIAEQKVLLARLETEDRAQSQLVSRLRQIFSPVIPVLSHVVVMPVVGELTIEQMETFTTSLLSGVERHNARLVLLDITAVPQIDEAVAEKLIQAVDAIALLGAECVLVGVRPDVAHSSINLSIDLSPMVSLRDLQSGIEYALGRMGRRIVAAE